MVPHGGRSKHEQTDEHAEAANESGSDAETVPRTSEEVRRHDQETLGAEEEAEQLLVGGGRWTRGGQLFPQSGGYGGKKWGSSGKRGQRRRRKGGEQKEVMYEMEEGGPRSSSAEDSSGHSSEADTARLGATQARQKKTRGSAFRRFAAIHVLIVLVFLVLLYAAWRASLHQRSGEESKHPSSPHEDARPGEDGRPQTAYRPQYLSNGTHTFAPTTVLISLDGFRADFLYRNLTPTLSAFARNGVSPKYMLPSFPSLTFPNHYTLVTGLHPESHGIVGNTFWEPEQGQEFYYTDPARSLQREWWDGGEPVWVTAERQAVRTAIHMWPGSEVQGGIGGVEPTFVDRFNEFESLDNKAKRILGWLDLPDESNQRAGESAQAAGPRPQLIAAYVPNVDSDGHLYGPNSTHIRSTIADVDGMLGNIFQGIDGRNLTDIVNIIVVSDHGMATVLTERLIQLEDLIDVDLIEHIDGWPLYGLRPKDTSEAHVHELYDQLIEKSKTPEYNGLFDVYLRDENMPERYHFSHNQRIAPLWIVPQTGWAIVTKDEYDVSSRQAFSWELHGLHGYDNQHPLMRAIFVARGPAFPHGPGSELAPFQNTEIYNIVCDSLGIEPAENNGTLRLPLKPSGAHDFDQPPDIPNDPQADGDSALPPEPSNLDHLLTTTHQPPVVPHATNRPDSIAPSEGESSTSPDQSALPTPPTSSTPSSDPEDAGDAEQAAERPVVHDGISDDEKEGTINRWWEWVSGRIDAIKGWAQGFWGGKDKDANTSGDEGRH